MNSIFLSSSLYHISILAQGTKPGKAADSGRKRIYHARPYYMDPTGVIPQLPAPGPDFDTGQIYP